MINITQGIMVGWRVDPYEFGCCNRNDDDLKWTIDGKEVEPSFLPEAIVDALPGASVESCVPGLDAEERFAVGIALEKIGEDLEDGDWYFGADLALPTNIFATLNKIKPRIEKVLGVKLGCPAILNCVSIG